MRHPLLIVTAAAAMALTAGEAAACARPELIFHSGRRYPTNAIVAEVEIFGAQRPGGRVEARVRRMIQGPRGARRLLLRPYPQHICHMPPRDGSRGIIVAWPNGMENGIPVVRPTLQ